jgi:hypothetical protein
MHPSDLTSVSQERPMSRQSRRCPECASDVDRRRFLKSVGGALTAGAALPLLGNLPGAWAAPTSSSAAETAAQKLHATLSETQRQAICFPFEHELRHRISANWHITEPKIGEDFYTVEQRGLITEIVKGMTSEEGFERLNTQMEYDDGGLNFFSVALFGEPGQGKFEFELTGRHLTLRADGDSVDHAAFGGPIVYGHGDEDPASNIYHYQTQQTNEVFKALDANQAAVALVENAPGESAVQLQGEQGTFPGIRVGDLSADQRQLVEQTLGVLLAPYREEDRSEVMEILKAHGGVESLHMAFYKQGDLGDDKVWDIWRVEGPAFVWHFRGAPHVHAYINIGAAQA